MYLKDKSSGGGRGAPSLAGFAAWLETMPAAGRYDWRDGRRCAGARYAASVGMTVSWNNRKLDRDGLRATWKEIDRIAYGFEEGEWLRSYEAGWTYGAALERARRAAGGAP